MPADMILHRGGWKASRDEVFAVKAPKATHSWHPQEHGFVLAKIEQVLDQAGYNITRQQLALSHEGARFFAAIDLEAQIVPNMTLAVAVRNSHDKSFPMGLAGATRTSVMICDNLAIHSYDDNDELWGLTVTKKHTKNGAQRFSDALALAVTRLGQFRELAAQRLTLMRDTPIDDQYAEAAILRAYESDILSHRVLRDVIGAWRDPGYDWGPPSLFRLHEAMTMPLQYKATSNPSEFARQTNAIMALVSPKGSFHSPEPSAPTVAPSSHCRVLCRQGFASSSSSLTAATSMRPTEATFGTEVSDLLHTGNRGGTSSHGETAPDTRAPLTTLPVHSSTTNHATIILRAQGFRHHSRLVEKPICSRRRTLASARARENRQRMDVARKALIHWGGVTPALSSVEPLPRIPSRPLRRFTPCATVERFDGCYLLRTLIRKALGIFA